MRNKAWRGARNQITQGHVNTAIQFTFYTQSHRLTVKGKEKSANHGLTVDKETSGFSVGNRMEMVKVGALGPRRKLLERGGGLSIGNDSRKTER